MLLTSTKLLASLVAMTLLASACQNDLEQKPLIKHKEAATSDKDAKPTPIPSTSSDDASAADKEETKIPEVVVPVTDPKDTETKDPEVKPPVVDTKSEGCAGTTELAEGEIKFNVGPLARKYVVRKPKGYSKEKAWPLVLALHPNGSNTSYWDGTSGDRAIRKQFGDKAIIIIAQARVNDWRGDLPVELAYFDAMLVRAKKELCVDTSKIYSMGFSGGGSFSGVLGCNRTDIRAFAAGGAVIYFDPKTCVGKPAAWVTIGDDEAIKDRLTFRDYWRDYNKCTAQTKVLTPATCVEYTCPDALHPTQFCSHPGGHDWPTFGTETVWNFFSKF